LLDDILAHLTDLDAIAQLQLLQDLRLLAEGNQITYATVVPLLTRFASNSSAVVNAALYQVAGNLKKFVEPDSQAEKALQKLFDRLSQRQVARLGWLAQPGEVNDDQLTRPF